MLKNELQTLSKIYDIALKVKNEDLIQFTPQRR